MTNNNYTCYHLHSTFSLLDSATNYKDYIDYASNLGQKAICITEHGNLYSWANKWAYARSKGLKYLIGGEFYLTETLTKKIRDNYHTILIAKNTDGLKELFELNRLSTQNETFGNDCHVYYKNRLSFDEFLNISDNIIKISACVQSPLNKFYKKIETQEQKDMYDKLLRHYDYYEIQYHNFDEQIEYNKRLYELSKKYNKPLIAGTDTHSLNEYKAKCRTILQWGKTENAWGDSENECDLTYKTYEELVDCFKQQDSLPMDVVLEAIENTNRMADSVVDNYDIDTKTAKYPILYGEKDESVLWERINNGYKEKVAIGEIEDNPQYLENAKEEMRVFKKTNMIGFMLSMSLIIKWAKDNGIAVGFARGSCFTKDALVLTDSGYKTIDNVKIGDKVISDDCKWHNVINTMSFDVDEPMIEIKHYKQGSSYKKFKQQCTLDHKFLVNRNGIVDYVKAEDLKVGDLLCSPKIKADNNYKTEVIDLNDYNIFDFDYDDKYIYEKNFIANEGYKFSPRWFGKHGYKVNSSFAKNVIRGWRPKIINKVTQRNIDELLRATNFKTLDDYEKYCLNKSWSITPIKRYVKKDMFFNVIVGMMYGDGWTQKNYALGLAVNSSTKNINKKLFFKFANKLGISSDSIYINVAKGKDLQQLFINSRILNNYWRTNYFVSKKGNEKVFNSELFNQPIENLRGLLYGLKITDGSVNKHTNKICYDSTSLSIIGAYNILDNIVNKVMPNAIDVRLSHTDKRNPNWVCKESYKTRRNIKKTSKTKILEDDNYWYLPILELNYIEKHKNTVYDLTVENKHSYTVNNIVVHNCAGSTVAFLTDIIDVDPVVRHTIFSRFCNEDRVELGDIDSDWYEDDRPKVYNHIIDTFGKEKTSYIVAYGTLADKSVIDTIGKAFRVMYEKGKREDCYSLSEIAQIKKEWDINQEQARKDYPDIFYYYDGLVNCEISQGMHPAGILVSSVNITSFCGTFYGKNKSGETVLISNIDMEECHDLNLVKYDILSLKTIGVIDKTFKMIGKKFPKAYQVDWNDQDVLKDISDDSTMLFQFESDFGKSSIKKMQVKSVEDICLCSACIRPSGASYREEVFAHRWHKNPSELVDNILSNSYGYLVYQEQTIAFLQEACGFSGSEADSIRRAIGQKNKEKIAGALPRILEGYCKKSEKPREVAEEEAKDFLKIIEDASSYSFGFNHSVSYAMLTYLMGWLRYYYPTEFCTAYLNCAKNDTDLLNGTRLAKLKGCTIENPKFGLSSNEYGCDSSKKVIYKGVSSIKDMQSTIGDELYRLSQKKKYNNFLSLLFDIKKKTSCNKTSLDILIKLDYFSDFGDINYLLNVVKYYNKYIDNGNFGKTKRKQFRIADLDDVKKYYPFEKETILKFKTEESKNGNTIYVSEENMYKLIVYLCSKLKKNTTTLYDRITYEAKLLGYVSITSSDSPYWAVTNVDVNQYGTPFASLYRVSDGLTGVYKVNRQYYKEYGLNTGDIIYPLFNTKNKSIKKDNKWVQTDETYEELSAWKWSD